MAELSKCGKRVQQIIVQESRNSPSQNQAHMIYKDLRSVLCLKDELNILCFKDEVNILRLAISVSDIFMHEADHAYSSQSTWSLYRLATDVPSIACVINLQSIFVHNLDLSNLPGIWTVIF